MDVRPLLQPLLPITTDAAATTATTSPSASATVTTLISSSVDDNKHDELADVISSNSGIILRLLSIAFVGILSIWANYEASKGFDITVVNDARDSPAGQRFDLLFVRNDEARRMVLIAAKFLDNILYSDHHLKMRVNSVTARLAGRNLTSTVVVKATGNRDFWINISPQILQERDVNRAMASALQHGMAKIWLWGSHLTAPAALVDGIVEYISLLSGSGAGILDAGGVWSPAPGSNTVCWEANNTDPVAVARFLSFCEKREKGFIGRLSKALEDGWHDRTVDDALGVPAQSLCDSG
ncbi:uncharacterized protein LOC131149026 [Malania oleifera]|uniref:uncharacterized protein LOC131149026 n=1 Tax=Malania oleifera TaxID=397392 RepID=UPI0025ADAC87|nr:uncharacterized protein LOC131149026 [Malania oleifera]